MTIYERMCEEGVSTLAEYMCLSIGDEDCPDCPDVPVINNAIIRSERIDLSEEKYTELIFTEPTKILIQELELELIEDVRIKESDEVEIGQGTNNGIC